MDDVITHLYATLGPRLSVGLQNRAPMSARAVAVIRPAQTIIPLPTFLFILSGNASGTLVRTGRGRHLCAPDGPILSTRTRTAKTAIHTRFITPHRSLQSVRCSRRDISYILIIR